MLRNIRPYSKYVLDAVKSIKVHLDSNPFQYKTAAALLENVSAPNRSCVEKAFREVFGTGIKEYQVRRRLEASKQFLESGMTKKQIASKCYYSCQASFCRAFKKEFSITPTEWLNNYH
jgi:AraC-like DNA-binding protein